jgi:hypothetical protein
MTTCDQWPIVSRFLSVFAVFIGIAAVAGVPVMPGVPPSAN